MDIENIENANGHFPASSRSDNDHVLSTVVDSFNNALSNTSDNINITDLTPNSYNSSSLNVRVLHQWQGRKDTSPLHFLLGDSSGWIDAIHFGKPEQKHLYKSYFVKNHCFAIKKFLVTNRNHNFSSFSGHRFQINLTSIKIADIEKLTEIPNCRTYMPFKFWQFTDLHRLPSVTDSNCQFKYDVIGVIDEVHDMDKKVDTGAKSRTIVIKNSKKSDSYKLTCVLYGSLADVCSTKQIGKVLVVKNAKVITNGDIHTLSISDANSCAFSVINDTDANIMCLKNRNEFYEPIKPRVGKRKSNENASSLGQSSSKKSCDTKAGDFKGYKITTILSIIKGSKNHKMTNMKVTLENVLMTWSRYDYIGCTNCGSKLDVGKVCHKCQSSHVADKIFCANSIDLHQENDKLSEIGCIKACFSALARQIDEMENENSSFKKVPRVQLKGVKGKRDKIWQFEIIAIKDQLNQEIKDSPENTQPEVENVHRYFTEMQPLEVKVVKYQSGIHKRDEKNSFQPTSTPKGAVLIVNNEDFIFNEKGEPDDGHSQRVWTEIDVNNVKKLFTQLGYAVLCKPNLTMKDMKNVLIDFKTYIVTRNVDIALVFIMSHGRRDLIQMTDGFLQIWNDIVYQFNDTNFPEMKGKPKGFFIQACQQFPEPNIPLGGADCTSQHMTQPWGTFVSFSSAPGFLSTRWEELGSIYIYKLVEIVMKNSHEKDLNSMFVQLKNEMMHFQESQVTNECNFLGNKLLYLQ